MYNKKLAKSIKEVLEEIGENPNREGLIKTPSRVAKAWQFFSVLVLVQLYPFYLRL